MKHKPWHVVTRGRRSGVGLRFVFIFITAFASPSTLLASVNGHGGSPERPSYLLTVIQSFRGGTSPSGTCLSILSLFLPQASTLRPQILSSCGCLDIGAPSRSPSCPPAAFGTRSQAPGRGAPELAEVFLTLTVQGQMGKACCLWTIAPGVRINQKTRSQGKTALPSCVPLKA